jgi:hypothetical protein
MPNTVRYGVGDRAAFFVRYQARASRFGTGLGAV